MHCDGIFRVKHMRTGHFLFHFPGVCPFLSEAQQQQQQPTSLAFYGLVLSVSLSLSHTLAHTHTNYLSLSLLVSYSTDALLLHVGLFWFDVAFGP